MLFIVRISGLQFDIHSIKRHLDSFVLQNFSLGRIFVENGIGVVNMNQDFARLVHGLQYFDHTARAGLWQMTDVSGFLIVKPDCLHLVIQPESAIDQQAIRLAHELSGLIGQLPQTWRIEKILAAALIGHFHTNIVADMGVITMG